MTTDLGLTYCNRDTANKMADEGTHYSGAYFMEKYGVLWPLKYSMSITAAFVRARLKELYSGARDIQTAKKYVNVEYIKEMFELNEMPMDLLWIGDTTMEMAINTFLRAFIDNGYGIEDVDDEIEVVDEVYTKIRGEMCKKHGPYKKWMIYRAWNVPDNHGKMKYFAVKNGEVLSSGNLSGIKYCVSQVA